MHGRCTVPFKERIGLHHYLASAIINRSQQSIQCKHPDSQGAVGLLDLYIESNELCRVDHLEWHRCSAKGKLTLIVAGSAWAGRACRASLPK